MLQKELAKRLKARYDTKMDGNEWLEVSSDGIPLCRIKYNGQFLSNADQNLSDEYHSKISDIQDEISTVRECINRLDFGKKYCQNSPTVEEIVLQRAVMVAIMKTAARNTEVLRTLKLHIGMGLAGEKSEDNSIDLQIRIAKIDAEFKKCSTEYPPTPSKPLTRKPQLGL